MSADPRLFLIDDIDALGRFTSSVLPELEGACVALDIEEENTLHFRPRVALVQISARGRDFILDPLRLPSDPLSSALEFLCFGAGCMLLHGARNDIVGIKRDFGFGPHRVRDTQICARFLGFRAFGLAALLEAELGLSLDKTERRSDWSERPLSPAQLAYARADTAHLHELDARLRERVSQAGWLDAVEEEEEAMTALAPEDVTFDPDGWRRIKKRGAMEDAEKDRLAALWAWRHRLAETYNLNPTKVLPPWALVQFAGYGRLPSARSSLWTALGLRLGPDERQELEHCLTKPPRRASAQSGGSRTPRLAPAASQRLEALMAWRHHEAERSGLEEGWLAPRHLLEAIALHRANSPEDFASIPEVRRWRIARYAEDWWRIGKR